MSGTDLDDGEFSPVVVEDQHCHGGAGGGLD